MHLECEFNFTVREEDVFSSTKTSVVISLFVLTVKYLLLRNSPLFFLRNSGHLHGTIEEPPANGPCKYVMSSSDNYNAWVCIQ
jgi:hypothetical protein